VLSLRKGHKQMTKLALKRLLNKKIKETRNRINELDNQMHQSKIPYEIENCDFAMSFHSGRLDTLKTIAKLLD
jgi:hypothetical protein